MNGAYPQQVAQQNLSLGGVPDAENGRLWTHFNEQFKAGHQANSIPQAVSDSFVCFDEAKHVFELRGCRLVAPRRSLSSSSGQPPMPVSLALFCIPFALFIY